MYMSFARCHFRAQKSLDFQGPPLPMALLMDFPPSRGLHKIWLQALADLIFAKGRKLALSGRKFSSQLFYICF